ncbi:MAG: phosphatase PAP2 family protein [Xanthobacteraceae bacterium]
MDRTGLMIAFAVAAVVGVVLGVFPQLDLIISGWLFDPGSGQFTLSRLMFAGRLGWLATARDAGMWAVAALVAPAVVALIAKAVRPQTALVVPGRAVVYLLLTLALAPGLMANGLLKDHGGRSRPIDVKNFAGTDRFVAWWDPRGDCPQNCSFVSGESSGAFWAFAPASLVPAPYRPLAYGAVIVFGSAIGALRMAFGGHFLSDVAFAGVFTFLIVWGAHGLIYRWRATALSDEAIERAIERLVMPIHRMLGSAAAAGSARRRGSG